MSPDVLTLESTGSSVSSGTFDAELLGEGPDAGAKLTGSNSGCGMGCGLIAIVIVTGALTFGASQVFPEFGWPDWTLGLILVPGAATFLAVLGYGLMLRWAVHPGEAAISPWPLRPGMTGEVRFAQRLKKGLALNELRAELTCTEVARYRVGTNTRTERNERYRISLPPVTFDSKGGRYEPARQAVTAVWEITIPADAPPSLDTHNSDVNWELAVTLDIDRHPDARTNFPLRVL
ncbi:hypothetical protein [Alienimonas chondri]|uniref:Uncharacterized protein n=1 Tax=Alienimonas chondri TaxID=2681879 RepID=A0ABX1VDY8_9PLAN|nr:hypothetical protein [Alienimonas chondri]NNJ25487.1 hypothetical protein [Alienimonas chondri]